VENNLREVGLHLLIDKRINKGRLAIIKEAIKTVSLSWQSQFGIKFLIKIVDIALFPNSSLSSREKFIDEQTAIFEIEKAERKSDILIAFSSVPILKIPNICYAHCYGLFYIFIRLKRILTLTKK